MVKSSTTLTHKRVLSVAAPIVLANATIPILGAVDTAVVGQMGLAAPIGAVGIGAIIISAIYWLFGFLRMGTTGLTAQAIGSKDDLETSALLVRGILIGLSAGLILILTQVPLLEQHLVWLQLPLRLSLWQKSICKSGSIVHRLQ